MYRALAAFSVALRTLAFGAPGDLDPSFGNGGTVVVSVPSLDLIGDLGVQPDGGIVLAVSHIAFDGTGKVVLLRYASDGTPDGTFGSGGTVTEPGEANPVLLVDPDGSLIVAALRCPSRSSGCLPTVRRYDAAGHVDPGFVAPDLSRFAGPSTPEVLGRDSANRLLVGGNAGSAPAFFVWLARFEPDGTFDPTFGDGGVWSKSIAFHGASLGSLLVDADGSVVAGVTGATIEGAFSALLRLAPAGTLQSSLGTPFGYLLLARAADGGVVAAGTLQGPDHPVPRIGLAHATADLTALTALPGGEPAGSPRDALVQPNGKIVVAARLGDPEASFAVLRWTVDGLPDTSFGQDGAAFAFPGEPGTAERIVRQSDGKLVAAGFVQPESVALARFLGDPTTPGPTTTTTLLEPLGACDGDPATCDTGDSCIVGRCQAGRCVGEPRTGLAAATCLCTSPMPTCAARITARVGRACGLLTRGSTLTGRNSERLVRRAVRFLSRTDRRLIGHIGKGRARRRGCLRELLGPVDRLARRAAAVLDGPRDRPIAP